MSLFVFYIFLKEIARNTSITLCIMITLQPFFYATFSGFSKKYRGERWSSFTAQNIYIPDFGADILTDGSNGVSARVYTVNKFSFTRKRYGVILFLMNLFSNMKTNLNILCVFPSVLMGHLCRCLDWFLLYYIKLSLSYVFFHHLIRISALVISW